MTEADKTQHVDDASVDELASGRKRWWWPFRRRKRRKLTKRLVVTLFTVNAGVIGAIIYMFSYDPGITPEIEAYFEPPPAVALEHNGYAALAGLDAPADADMVAFGVAKLRSYLEGTPKTEYTPLGIRSIDLNLMECWYLPYIEDTKRNCMPAADLEETLSRNDMMIQRYNRLYLFPVFDVQPQTEFRAAPINTLKELHKLQMAKISLMAANGQKEEALNLWIEEMHFQRNLSLSQMTALDMIFRLEMLERSARLLPHLIRGEESLVRLYYDDLMDVVDPPGRDLWPFADTIRNEGILWTRRVQDGAKRFTTDDGRVMYRPVKINIFKRKFYDYAQALERAYEYPTGEGVQMAIAAVQKDYNNTLFRGMEDFSSPAQSIVSNFMMSGVVSTAHLLGRVFQREELLRMLSVFIEAEAKGLAPEEMAAFLGNQPEEMRSNMTGEPYSWDAEMGLIYSVYYDRLLGQEVKSYLRIGVAPQN